MNYIVSGFMRSGTSVMMRALELGGMKIFYNDEQEKNMQSLYPTANPEGFYELLPSEISSKEFPQMYRGGVVKCFLPKLVKLKKGNYNVILMTRDHDEIKKSCKRDLNKESSLDSERLHMFFDKLSKREDMDVIKIDLNELKKDALSHFKQIAESGWAIDPDKASSIIRGDV